MNEIVSFLYSIFISLAFVFVSLLAIIGIGWCIWLIYEFFNEIAEEKRKEERYKRLLEGIPATKVKNADQLLECIGFMEIPLLVDCELFYVNRRTGMEITFYLEDKHISIAGGPIDVNLYKAIGEKMEEMGWLEDE